MELWVAVMIWVFLVFLMDMEGFEAFVLMVIISIVFFGSCSAKVETDITAPPVPEIVKPQKLKFKSTPVTNFGNVKQEYIDNTMRSTDSVIVVKINGEVLACDYLNECFNPTIKKHLDNVLYACNSTKCYTIKESL